MQIVGAARSYGLRLFAFITVRLRFVEVTKCLALPGMNGSAVTGGIKNYRQKKARYPLRITCRCFSDKAEGHEKTKVWQ